VKKTNLTSLGAPYNNFWKKTLVLSPGKNTYDAHAHNHVNLHHFFKLCYITPPGNT